DLYPFSDDGPATRAFLSRVFEILWQYVDQQQDRSSKILDFHMPDKLMQMLDLDLPEDPLDLGQLFKDCSDALKFQVRTGEPELFGQVSYMAMRTDYRWLILTISRIINKNLLIKLIIIENKPMVYNRNFPSVPAVLAGGSVSNLYAVMAARHKKFPDYKTMGLKALPQLVMYTSEDVSSLCPSDPDTFVAFLKLSRGKMIVEELEKEIVASKARGHVPFFVNCTAGSTVIGAFDPIHPIADICEKHGLWLHIDSAWGGGCLLSRKHRHLMSGIERSDSVTWNPHKLMGTHLQCSTIHLKEDGLLLSCNQMCAEYLFQQDKHYDVSYDTGDKVPQCGRHNDIFKLWLMWRAKGTSGFERQIDHLFDMSNYLVKKIKERPDMFYLLLEPELVNVCFWYIPERLRNTPHSKQKEEQLGVVTAQLKARMMNTGTLMITYQPIWDKPNFFRNIVSNAGVRPEDIDFLVQEMDRLGHDL
ncbi:unnamed protein product, partial [Ixodes persulcatus]